MAREGRNELGYMREVRPGVWRIRKQAGRLPDGRVRTCQETVHGDEQQARAALYAMCERMGAMPAEADGMTCDTFFRLYYLPGLERQGRAEVTTRGYESVWRCHVSPRWGRVALDAVRDGDVRAWVWQIASPEMARKAYKILKQVLRAAYDYGFLDEPPLQRRVPLPASPRERPVVWDARDVARALPLIEGDRIEPLVLAMLGGGLRREEAMALTMADLRFEEAVGMDGMRALTCFARVDKAYTRHDGLKPTKNPQSVRTVAIGEPFSSRLAACMPKSGPIVAGKVPGTIANPDECSRRFSEMFAPGGCLEGLPRVKMMNLRHTHATLMLASGVDPATTAKAHGHSAAVEYQHYLAPTDRTMARAANLVADELRRAGA